MLSRATAERDRASRPRRVAAGAAASVSDARHDRAPAPVAAGPARALPDDRDALDRGRGARVRHLPAPLRRAQARDPPRRGAPAQRPPPQPARREHPRGRPRRGRRAVAGARARCSSRACATSAPRSPARTTRSTPPSSRPSTGTGSSTGSTRPSTSCPTPSSTSRACRAAAKRAVALTVRNNINHASIMTWSLANEPAGNRSELGVVRPAAWHASSADGARAVRELDDTRLVAIDRQSRFGEPLDQLRPTATSTCSGVNEYFGWYDSYKADLVRPTDHHRRARPLPRPAARGQPEPAAGDHRVRRRGRARTAPRASRGSLPVPDAASCSTTCASTPRSATWPARSTGRCATSG